MLLAALRASSKAPLRHRILDTSKLAGVHLKPLISRSCSSSSNRQKEKGSSTWEILNRIPTPACLDSAHVHGQTAATSTLFPPEIEALYRGNQRFRDAVAASATPTVLRDLAAKGQQFHADVAIEPPFLLLDCSDSRVGEQVIFSAEPGTLFTTGNVANQFHEHDLNSKAVLAYAVDSLRVKHVIVMGHYGCGGVAAATLAHNACDEDNPVQAWIAPIRQIYETSERSEIVSHRAARRELGAKAAPPHLHDAGFRALVEENVKANVRRVARSAVITNHYKSLEADPERNGVFIHGWVYDIETGEVTDLGVTVGPPGRTIPLTPFPIRS
ncbi:hypothetical protein H0H92_008458 [Tricholoma furcatifolium]|nr:hypothetical protein H0H92_008458 [Tricholoma furcatifolium]